MFKQRTIIFTLALAAMLWGGGYVFALNSNGFRVSREYCEESTLVTQRLGKIRSIFLEPLGFQMKTGGGTGSASYKMLVSGSSGKSEVLVELKLYADGWRVVDASMSK